TATGTGGSITPAGGYFNAGESVPVTATAASGYLFAGFSGDLTGSTNPQSITMDAPHSVVANFTALTQVTVDTTPAGRNFTVDGTTYTAQQAFLWEPGS